MTSHVLTIEECEAFARRIADGLSKDHYWTHEEMGRALATIAVLRDELDTERGIDVDLRRAFAAARAKRQSSTPDDPCADGHANDIPFRDPCPKCGQ